MAFRRWFPRSLQEQAAFINNFTVGFEEIGESLGFTAAEIESLQQDNAVMQYLARMEISVNNFKKSFQIMRDDLTAGDGTVEPNYVQLVPPDAPPIVPSGIFNRLFRLADRICAAEKYTPVVGARLGILPKPAQTMRAEAVKLSLKAATLDGARVEISFVRGKTDGVCLYVKRFGSEEWTEGGRFFYSPAIVTIPLAEPGKPEQIQIRGRYLKFDNPFGDFSDGVVLTLKP